MTALSLACTTVDVTPPAGTALAGYVARGSDVAHGCHDPLEATLVWLSDPSTGQDVVWISLDVVGVDVDLSRAVAASVAEATGCKEAAVLLCASHSHSSAAGWFRRPGREMQPDPDDTDSLLRGRLVQQIAEAARSLPSRLRPVCLLSAEGPVRGVGANRHRLDGPRDDTVGCTAAVDESGSVVAVLVNYASHPTVLGHANLLWSADWPGAAREALADALIGRSPFGSGPPGKQRPARPTILFLQGAAGDTSARFVRRSQSFAEVDRLGGLFAAQTLTALLDASETPTVGSLVVTRTGVTLPTRPRVPPAVVLGEADRARSAWETVRAEHAEGSAQERIARTRHEGAQAALQRAHSELPATYELPLTVVALGDHAWVHLPVELFASFGLRIRAESPFATTRVVGYTDGYFGYVPDAAAYREGTYEAGVSVFDAEGAELLCRRAIDLVQQAARKVAEMASERPAM